MAINALAASLVEDYEALGFGVRETPTSIRSFDGESLLELSSEDGKILEIFLNGDRVENLQYTDINFSQKLLVQVSSALNI